MRAPIATAMLVVVVPAVVLPVAADPPPRAQSPRVDRVHEVRRGDTLGGIARTYGVSVAAIVTANRLRDEAVVLKVGQRLVIPSAPLTKPAARPRPRAPRVPLRPPPNLILAVPDFGELLPLFSWPTEGPITSTFGRRRRGWHRGIDIKADLGTPIYTAAPGVVTVSAYEPRYGRVVKIEHINGFITVYAHNSENLVEAGDRVFTGQLIGAIGRTGRATAHHLHFEIRQAGLAYNPLYLLPLPPRTALVDESQDEEMIDDGDE
jgi:murein DD-endopeptidase MepM/ murein hydrolase activator NlpD